MTLLVLVLLSGNVLTFQEESSTIARKLNDSAYYYYDRSAFDKATALALRAKESALKDREPEELYRSYTVLSSIEMRKGHLQVGITLQKQCLAIANDINRNDLKARTLSSMASTLSQLARYDSAELLLNQIVKMKDADTALLISVYGRLGLNHKRQQQYDKAVANFLQSLSLSKSSHDSLSSARSLANIGNVYEEQSEAKRALPYYQEALQLLDTVKHALSISGITVFLGDAYQSLGDYKQAEQHLRKALRMMEKLNLPASEAYALESLGILYFKQGNIKQAIVEFDKSLSLNRTLDNWSNLESVLLNLAQCYLETGDLKKTEVALQEAQTLADAHKHAIGLKEVYKYKAQLDSARGDFRSSLDYYKRSTYLKDSLFSIEKTKALEEVNKKYEVLQKEEIIRTQQEEINRQRTSVLVTIVIAGVLLISGVCVFYFYKRREQLKKSVEEQQREKQKLMEIVLAQEQMQQKIARDLHDSFLQTLGATKISLESIYGDHTASFYQNKLHETAAMIDRACEEARTLSHQLLPYSLEKHGLIRAIEELLYNSPTKTKTNYELEHNLSQDRFSNTIEINCYRIVQELLNNIAKHAAAEKVILSIAQTEDVLILTIRDNGCGFETSSIEWGAGLLNIYSRLKSMNGSLAIESTLGSGTTVVCHIPIL